MNNKTIMNGNYNYGISALQHLMQVSDQYEKLFSKAKSHLENVASINESFIQRIEELQYQNHMVEEISYISHQYIYHYETIIHTTPIIIKLQCNETTLLRILENLLRVNSSIAFFKKNENLDQAKKYTQELISLRRNGIKRVDEAIGRFISSQGYSRRCSRKDFSPLLQKVFLILGTEFSNQSRYRKIYREERKAILNESLSSKFDIYKECWKYIEKMKQKDHQLHLDEKKLKIARSMFPSLDRSFSKEEIFAEGRSDESKSIQPIRKMFSEVFEVMMQEYIQVQHLFIPVDREVVIFKMLEDICNVLTLSIDIFLQIEDVSLFAMLSLARFMKRKISNSQLEFLKKGSTLDSDDNNLDIFSKIVESISKRLETYERFFEKTQQNPFGRSKEKQFMYMHPECPYIDAYTKLIFKYSDIVVLALRRSFPKYKDLSVNETLLQHKRVVIASLLNDTYKFMNSGKTIVENWMLRLNTLQYIIEKIVSKDKKEKYQYDWILKNDLSEYVREVWGPFIHLLHKPIDETEKNSSNSRRIYFHNMYSSLVNLFQLQKDVIAYNRRLVASLRESILTAVMDEYTSFFEHYRGEFVRNPALQGLTPENVKIWINNLFKID